MKRTKRSYNLILCLLSALLLLTSVTGCFESKKTEKALEQVVLESIPKTTDLDSNEAVLDEPLVLDENIPMGTGEAEIKHYVQIEDEPYLEWLQSEDAAQLVIEHKDEVYAARLKAEEEAAALQAQQAQYYQNLQAYVPPAEGSAPAVGVESKGSAGLHDTAVGAATIINMINDYRISIGLAAMMNDATMQQISLQRIVQVGVSYRATGDSTGHTHNGMGALQWIASVYGANCGQAENTGFFTSGTKTPEDIYYAFFNSHGHYVNMMNPAYTRVGVALYYDPVDNREYVVMNFGF